MEVSFQLPKGHIMALTGPSGAGKTTLLKQIAGLINPETGRISFNSTTWFDSDLNVKLPTQQRNIGFVFQDYALFPNMTVRENLLFALSKGEDQGIVADLLKDTGLTQLSGRKPFQLSGGQQQRVALARALVLKPDLLLLDEPFAALDHIMRHQLQDLLLKFQQRYQFSVIIVTHDIGEIFRLAEQVAVMDNGKLVSFGTPYEVYLNKKTPSGHLIIHAEVLSCQKQNNILHVQALVENKIRELELPVEMEIQLLPGTHFTLQYGTDSPQIGIIKTH
ncbi:sulfate/molybdate ABC transporter ATP-binding protein [Dyadobacter arcticus]|uniref:Molybdate transport system ATP-binding protein n=1 Tax=Dyadobacter arcticus TaxID=1078754 RepID=A0ABX0US32_9BACT|nr:ATP-binding cassette domain-containing protein [Dyadobacter arcticus]NIJ55786.1 molybdate transport system ATP-binding protein [Dyadobacter arcticus]